MKQLFFNRETWSDCNEQLFLAQAHACAIESLKNVYDPSDGKPHPSHLLDQSCVYNNVHKVSYIDQPARAAPFTKRERELTGLTDQNIT